jgi:hypothetical protein
MSGRIDYAGQKGRLLLMANIQVKSGDLDGTITYTATQRLLHWIIYHQFVLRDRLLERMGLGRSG